MNLEEYKRKVSRILEEEVDKSGTVELMKNYEPDFKMFLEKKWTPEFTTFAMEQGY